MLLKIFHFRLNISSSKLLGFKRTPGDISFKLRTNIAAVHAIYTVNQYLQPVWVYNTITLEPAFASIWLR
jgi:hypothetical protein